MAENAIMDLLERTVKRFSSMEDSYEIQKLVEKKQNQHNVFGFWSPFDGVGKTTALINVAYELAKRDLTVCIVDLNLLAPDVFRYLKPDFELNKNEEVKSLREKIVNSSIPITEFITKTKNNNIALLTPLFTEHPSVYCNSAASEAQEKRQLDVFMNTFKDLSVLYDYVLLDLSPTIIEISTIAAFRSCDNIITFIGHYPKSVENTMKTIKVFNELGLRGIFDNVVQGPIYTESWSEDELRTFNPSLNLITNLPYSNDVNVAGDNLEVFIAFNQNSSRASHAYREGIKTIATTLGDLAEETLEKNRKQIQDLSETATIAISGIQDYMRENNINPDKLENDEMIQDLITIEDEEPILSVDVIGSTEMIPNSQMPFAEPVITNIQAPARKPAPKVQTFDITNSIESIDDSMEEILPENIEEIESNLDMDVLEEGIMSNFADDFDIKDFAAEDFNDK